MANKSGKTARAGLDRAIVVNAAAEIVNSEGLDGLSLGKLAVRLGVQTPSLYNHIDGMPGLLNELALRCMRAIGERLARAAMGRAGPEALMAVAEAYRAYIKEFPGLYEATLRVPQSQVAHESDLGKAQAYVVDVVVAVVASYGLTGADAIHAVRGLRSVVHGFATLEVAGGFGIPLDCDESFRRLVTMLSDGIARRPRPESVDAANSVQPPESTRSV